MAYQFRCIYNLEAVISRKGSCVVYAHEWKCPSLKNEAKHDSCSTKTSWTENTSVKGLSATGINVAPRQGTWTTLEYVKEYFSRL